MSIYKMIKNNKEGLEKIFENWSDSLIPSALQGHMGEVWADDQENPVSGMIANAGYVYLAGEVCNGFLEWIEKELHKEKELQKELQEEEGLQKEKGEEIYWMAVPMSEQWDDAVQKYFGHHAEKKTRYAIKNEDPKEIFDKEYLQSLVASLDERYTLEDLHKQKGLYRQVLAQDWSKDMCIHFKDYSDYQKRGIGKIICHNGIPIAGVASYTVYDEGIEVTIHCRKDYQQKGLATVCGAALILECLQRGLNPNWDARTMISVHLSEKLGYHFDRPYTAYKIM